MKELDGRLRVLQRLGGISDRGGDVSQHQKPGDYRLRWQRAIALVINTLLVLLGISLGMVPTFVGFTIYLGGWVSGLVALVLGTTLTHRYYRRHLPEGTLGIVISLGILHLFVFTGILTTFLPPFYVAWGQPTQPRTVDLATLDRDSFSLPAYVRLQGISQRDLTVRDEYEIPKTKQSPARTIVINWTPLVPPGWQSPDPIRVLMMQSVFAEGPDDQVTVEGILYPFQPRWGERFIPNDATLYSSLEGVGMRADWLQARADFNFDAESLYVLSANTPQQLRTPLIVLAFLLLVYLAGLIWLSINPPPG
jgi:hypothetical protein